MGKIAVLAGRIVSGICGAFMAFAGLTSLFVRSADMTTNFARFGYTVDLLTPIGASALLGAVLYLIPRTAVLGAIVLTGYLGGAVATHVRVHDPAFVGALIFGILVWLGLWLRDERLRALVPLRD